MKDRLVELIKEGYLKAGMHMAYEEAIADNLLENGVIMSPVKVGDDVYYINGGYYKEPKYCKVSRPCKVVEVSLKLQRNGNRVM